MSVTVNRLADQGDADMQSYTFVDATHGWYAAGRSIYVTADGGHTWAKQYQDQVQILSLDFISASEGGAGTENGVLRTQDGGRTWARLPGAKVTRVDFVDGAHGWAYANGELVSTRDGGRTWSALALPCPGSGSPFSFVTPNDGFLSLVLGNVWLYATHDGGKNWSRLDPEIHPQSAVPDQPFDMQHWVAAITRFSGGAILRTEDAGAHWRQVADLGAPVQALSFPDPQRGWAATTRGLYLTADGGSTWVQLSAKVYRLGNPGLQALCHGRRRPELAPVSGAGGPGHLGSGIAGRSGGSTGR